MATDREPLLPEFTLPMHDPQQVYSERVGQRRLAYLDNNVWIELRDAKHEDARACLDACYRAVTAGLALFPLAFPSITEAIDIPSVSTRIAHCELLDALSNGVTFRTPSILLDLEARYATEWFFLDRKATLQRNEVFTSVPDHLGDGSYDFPAGWTPSMVRKFFEEMASDPRMRSVRFFADKHDWPTRHANHRERYLQLVAEARFRRGTREPVPKRQRFERALLDERLALLRRYVFEGGLRHLESLLGIEGAFQQMRAVTQERGEGGPARVQAFFERMPIMDQYARLLAQDAVDPGRKPQPQDFFDFEHAMAPPVYADAFATLDRRLATLSRNAKRGRATQIASLQALTVWLDSLDSADETAG